MPPTPRTTSARDGQSAFDDFLILRDNFSLSEQSWFDGDLDLDGAVTWSDFLLLRDAFTIPPSQSQIAEIELFAASAPEPALLPVMLAFVLKRRRRRAI